MIDGIAVVTDSASYLPAAVRERFSIRVAPMHIFLEGVDYREFVDLDAPAFYQRISAGAKVSTSQPSPGELLDLYTQAANDGATEVLSVHMSAALSGTVQSARIAARMSPIPVTVTDTGQASFIEGLCAWSACEALVDGKGIQGALDAIARTGTSTGNVFIVRSLDLMRKGGRLAKDPSLATAAVPLLALVDGQVKPIGQVSSKEEAIAAMVRFVESTATPGARLRVGVGNGDADELAALLEDEVRKAFGEGRLESVTPYTIGPAVGSHTGPGCTGIVFESLEEHG